MEQERQRAQAHSKRGGARIRKTTLRPERRPPGVPRSSPRTDGKISVAPPPPILSAGRKHPAPSVRIYPPSTTNRVPGTRIKLSPKPETSSQNARKNPLEAERFRDVLFPKEGESPVESRDAFFLSPLYVLIHTACALLCVHPMNLLTARMAFPLSAVIRATLPALIGTSLCSLTRLRFPDAPRLLFLAYRKLLWEVLIAFLSAQTLLWGEWDAQRVIARFALMFVLAPLITGAVVSVGLLYWDWLNAEEAE